MESAVDMGVRGLEKERGSGIILAGKRDAGEEEKVMAERIEQPVDLAEGPAGLEAKVIEEDLHRCGRNSSGDGSDKGKGETHGDDVCDKDENGGNSAAQSTAIEAASSDKPYTAFSKPKKLLIIFLATWGAFISPLSTSIYFPALNTLATYYSVTPSKINLSVTTYMIFQGLTPMFVGDFADANGFRPASIICFLVYFVANIALAVQDSFAALMILRCLQSAGSSGTIALRNGQLASIITPAERGTYLGIIGVMMLTAPAFAPLIGGLLSQSLGWRAIFWFLTILSGTCTVAYALFMPETNRKIVGDGSVPPMDWWNKSLLDLSRLGGNEDPEIQRQRANLPIRKLRWPNPWRSLEMIGEKDVAIVLGFGSLLYATLYAAMTSVPVLFHGIYGFNDIQVSLCYIPIGAGAALAAFCNGRLLDYNFRRIAKANGIKVEKKKGQDLRNFPIEKARLGAVLPLMLLGLAGLVGYGWALDKQTSLAAPLVLAFFGSSGTVASVSSLNNLLIDMYPANASTVTAGNNIVRCLVGAGASALINPMLDAMGPGWCFTLIGGICLLFSPLLFLEIRKGPHWREARRIRLEAKALRKSDLAQQRR